MIEFFAPAKHPIFLGLNELKASFLPHDLIAKNWNSDQDIWSNFCNASVLHARQQFKDKKFTDFESIFNYFSQCRLVAALLLDHDNTLSKIVLLRKVMVHQLHREEFLGFGAKRTEPFTSSTLYSLDQDKAYPFLNIKQFLQLKDYIYEKGRKYQGEKDYKELYHHFYDGIDYESIKVIENSDEEKPMTKVYYTLQKKKSETKEWIHIIHPDGKRIQELLEKASHIFEKLTTSFKTIEENAFIEQLLEFLWYFFNACPLVRGSNAVGKFIAQFIASLKKACLSLTDTLFPLDILAMANSKAQFINEAKTILLKQREIFSTPILKNEKKIEKDSYLKHVLMALYQGRLSYEKLATFNIAQCKTLDWLLELDEHFLNDIERCNSYLENLEEYKLFQQDKYGFILNHPSEFHLQKRIIDRRMSFADPHSHSLMKF